MLYPFTFSTPQIMLCFLPLFLLLHTCLTFNRRVFFFPTILFFRIVPVWKVARATSAAPIFFEPFEGKYVDGGVKANNPCMEALKVIKEYDRSRGHPERHFLLTVSVGTGVYPKQDVLSVDMRKNFWAKWQHLKQMVDMFVDAVSYT